jgi:hypothetical protein
MIYEFLCFLFLFQIWFLISLSLRPEVSCTSHTSTLSSYSSSSHGKRWLCLLHFLCMTQSQCRTELILLIRDKYWVYHRYEDKDLNLLGCHAVSNNKYFPTFRESDASSLGPSSRRRVFLKCLTSLFASRDCIIFRHPLIFERRKI